MTFWPTALGQGLISAYRWGAHAGLGGGEQKRPRAAPRMPAAPAMPSWLAVQTIPATSSPSPIPPPPPPTPRRMGLDNLWKPDLRGRIEAGIARVAAGQMSKDQVGAGTGWCQGGQRRAKPGGPDGAEPERGFGKAISPRSHLCCLFSIPAHQPPAPAAPPSDPAAGGGRVPCRLPSCAAAGKPYGGRGGALLPAPGRARRRLRPRARRRRPGRRRRAQRRRRRAGAGAGVGPGGWRRRRGRRRRRRRRRARRVPQVRRLPAAVAADGGGRGRRRRRRWAVGCVRGRAAVRLPPGAAPRRHVGGGRGGANVRRVPARPGGAGEAGPAAQPAAAR
jgi:hypothetical protein